MVLPRNSTTRIDITDVIVVFAGVLWSALQQQIFHLSGTHAVFNRFNLVGC